ncbi:hypothetical protein ACH5RR_003885 [Cinchona calisaya]|uniref:Uncharacterized protein n=1 Tax=Cinchona calisaya TaxID=153742 RepID=A0ABD3AWN6_9GENT
MAAETSEQQEQLINTTGSQDPSCNIIANEPVIDNIEYDQIIIPDKKSWKNLLSYIGPGFLVSIAYIDPGNFQTDLQAGAEYKYGNHLAEHSRKEYPRMVNFILWILAEIAIVACDIPEVIGTAFALNMLFKIPLCCWMLLCGAWICEAESSEVFDGLFVPQLKGSSATKLAISLLGAMVMPHNLFLHSALVLSRKIPRSNCQDLDLNKASFLLKDVLGSWSSKVFAIALLASGQSSTITGTYAGQYVMQGFLDLTMKPWIRNFLTRSLAIVPSLIVAIIGGSSGAGNLIIITSMILSFELPFALIPLLKFTSCKTKMGNHANSTSISAATWVISSLIIGINIYYLGEKLVTTLHHRKLRVVAIVFCGILGVLGMLVYLACVLYLMLRKTKNADHLLPETVQMAAELGNAPSVSSLPREDIVNMQLPQWRTTSDVNSSSNKVFIGQII